jgi:recombination DNA repair RAD52 pathway protein
MGFSAKQVMALKRNLNARQIRTREAHGRELSYIEGWFAISEANRIFGFDGWCRETVESRCVLARENRGTFTAIYTAKVRITVQADGATIVREGHGSGEGRGSSPVMFMISRSKPQKPTLQKEPLPRSASRSG